MSGKALHAVEVRGRESAWGIDTYITEETAADWRADGLIVHKIENTIPDWWPLPVRVWCFFQDAFNFRNPFR